MSDDPNFDISIIGEGRIPSPLKGVYFAKDKDRLIFHSCLSEVNDCLEISKPIPSFEKAGPREKIYFDPSKLKCGIVTCGGLCPGLNSVIRAIVLCLHHNYGVRTVYGFPYGYEGLTYRYGHQPVELTPALVDRIHEQGGTILGSSRGNQDISEMVDTLEQMNIGILFAIGGDGTLRGAGAIAGEIEKRGLKTSVIGIPKTIDNDISYIQRSFGFATAVSEAGRAINSAHTEAQGARNGIGLVKLMGRESGFIATFAALAYSDLNFCLIPEVPFTIEGFLKALDQRLERSRHAVIVVAEGAGQDILGDTGQRDASGNIRYQDIGIFLKDKIQAYFKQKAKEITLKYIDPSYTIRSVPADANDSAFCLLLGQNAVHAGMAGRTNMVVGFWVNEFTHVPIQLATSARKKVDPDGSVWNSVLTATGQPKEMR
ncbi:6-phosphofructokinase [uncultured Desulfobacterium sp.]|uniref:ATP-dependent 6-phosphofructokinase n=1 Tax=uncultured Desulfobacterium sp. TaxID=201089 RepID=A0A445N1K2_9BACT|nr:6-phosphofructokinase [uncultured Desulfobacterium sp.]